ncbi:MAG TPA: peroxidase-related enzyme [Acidimicrobiia bacterium]
MSISRFPLASLEDLPEDLRLRIEPIAERSGFVPNVFLAMAHRPDELRAFLDYHDALMERDSGLTKAEREMIVVATSAANECLYCVVAHGAILRVRAKDHEIADRIAANWRTAPVTDRQRAMLAFAVKLARTPEDLSPGDLEGLRLQGFSEADIWDIGSVTALFALSNRIAHLADLQPNPEFFTLARLPRT